VCYNFGSNLRGFIPLRSVFAGWADRKFPGNRPLTNCRKTPARCVCVPHPETGCNACSFNNSQVPGRPASCHHSLGNKQSGKPPGRRARAWLLLVAGKGEVSFQTGRADNRSRMAYRRIGTRALSPNRQSVARCLAPDWTHGNWRSLSRMALPRDPPTFSPGQPGQRVP